MAFGIPNSTDLTALATQLGGIVASVGPEETVVLNTAIQQLSDHATALESKAAADLGALEAPVLKRLDDAMAIMATLTGMIEQIVDRGLLIGLGPQSPKP